MTALALGPPVGDAQIGLAGTLVGLLRSTDGGVSWTPVHDGLRSPFIRCLALSPTITTDGVAAAGTSESGLHLSFDYGLTWQQSEFWNTHPSINAVVFSPLFAADGTIFAATTNQGIYISRTRGRSWNAADDGLPDAELTALAVSPAFANNKLLLAGVADHGIWKSVSGGMTWSPIHGPDVSSDIVALAFAPSDPDGTTVVAGYESDGLFVSTDGGKSWLPAATDLFGEGVNDVVTANGPENARQIVVAQADGSILATHAPEAQWHTLRPADPSDDVLALAAWDADESLQVLAGTYTGGVLRSVPSSDLWIPSNDGLVANPILAQAVQPNGEAMLAGTADGNVLRTIDAGSSWTATTQGLPHAPVNALAISPAFVDDGFGSAVVGPHVRHTTDGGTSWKAFASVPADAEIRSTAISPDFTASGVLALGGLRGTLLLSTNRGESWTRLDETFSESAITSIAFSPQFANDGVILASAIAHDSAIVYRSSDRGESWEAYVQANAVFPWLSIAIAIGPTTTTDAYAFATGSQVYFPGTGAGYWNVSHVAGTEAAVRDLVAITPADADTRYIAATSVGLFISSLTSHAWEEIAEPLAGRPIQAIDAVAHSDGYTLLATTMNGEIWTGRLAIVATQS